MTTQGHHFWNDLYFGNRVRHVADTYTFISSEILITVDT